MKKNANILEDKEQELLAWDSLLNFFWGLSVPSDNKKRTLYWLEKFAEEFASLLHENGTMHLNQQDLTGG